jgi:protein-S-isoprenylcysteine O-methyltransferase Ste14
MEDWRRSLHRSRPHLLAWVWSALLILQFVLALFVFTEPAIHALWIAGWLVWALGTIFAIVPILALRKKGGVPEGKSYMETTSLVNTGIYAVVRHPQGGTAGILLSLALALIGQHWLLVVLAALGTILIYIDTFNADEDCVQKFGQQYEHYMRRVPRVNFVTGIVRLLVRASSKASKPDADSR